MIDRIITQVALILKESLENSMPFDREMTTREALHIVYQNADIPYRMYISHNFDDIVEKFNKLYEDKYNQVIDEFKPKKRLSSLEKEIHELNTMGYRE